jgi:DNA-binding IclR family transcriptional regulator
VLRPTLRNGKPNLNYRLVGDNPRHSDVISDDLVLMHLQYSARSGTASRTWASCSTPTATACPSRATTTATGRRWTSSVRWTAADAGVPPAGGTWKSTSRAKALGIERMAERCVQGRGVMIDLHAHCRRCGAGGGPRPADGHPGRRRRDGGKTGDMVCLHTGFAQALVEMKGQPDAHRLEHTGAVLDGRDPKLLQWITDSGLSVLIADNYAVEAHPASSQPDDACCATLPLHEHCLFKLGIHLGEIWHLTPLAQWLRANGRHRFPADRTAAAPAGGGGLADDAGRHRLTLASMRHASDSNAAQKVCRLLRALSTPVPQRLADIAESSGVNKATALRLLESMAGEGFVVRDEATKRYTLGDEALALGIAMQGRDHIRDRARPTLLRLAASTGDTMLLSTRSGIESVCVDREFGSYPIRANYLDLGMRRPLGVGAGSLALLAWLPDDEVNTVLSLIAPRIAKRYPRISIDLLKTEVACCRGSAGTRCCWTWSSTRWAASACRCSAATAGRWRPSAWRH